MSKLNDDFLEEYKRLDNLCRDIYRSNEGIKNYINDMESVQIYESRSIPGWENDLKRLKTLKSVRNRLAHETGTLNADICGQNDVEWLKNFYNRIFRQDDPLSRLNTNRRLLDEKRQQAARLNRAARQSGRTANAPMPTERPRSTLTVGGRLLVFVLAALFITAILILTLRPK